MDRDTFQLKMNKVLHDKRRRTGKNKNNELATHISQRNKIRVPGTARKPETV